LRLIKPLLQDRARAHPFAGSAVHGPRNVQPTGPGIQ
jgi:hypothetical protein